MSSSKIRDLRAITDRMEAKAARGMPFLEEDASFHASIFGHLGNRTLEGLLTAFWKTFNASSEETRTGHDLPASARSHSQIVDALETGDTALAVHQLNVHFFDVRTRLSSQKKSASTPATLITTGEG
jgi:DNA-binding FadR family transcriptional regulator